MGDTAFLQALKLKGRAKADALAAALGRSEPEVISAVDDLVAAGMAEETSMGFRLTEAGRGELAALLADERATLDAAAVSALYEEFTKQNDAFKQIVTAWQMTSATELNDHRDVAYDRAVLDRLNALHEDFAPIAERAAALVPRLNTYPRRFAAAIEKVQGGDTDYVARPLIDSYHTVWFELHEELIQASGLSRADEAAAGRGA